MFAPFPIKKKGTVGLGWFPCGSGRGEGSFMQSQEGGCCGLSAVEDARRVAERLEIPYYVMNFKEDFHKYVIDYFVSEYEKSVHRIRVSPATVMSSGSHCFIVHWRLVRIILLPDTMRVSCSCRMAAIRSAIPLQRRSDQTYALYNLTQDQLSRTLMPVGDYDKPHIRQIAEEIGLPVATKHDSQDICFVPDHDYASFITQETGKEKQTG